MHSRGKRCVLIALSSKKFIYYGVGKLHTYRKSLFLFICLFIYFIFYSLAIGCNFDVSTCGFVQDTNDTFDWTRRKGSTPSIGTGPPADHTTGNGMKMFP